MAPQSVPTGRHGGDALMLEDPQARNGRRQPDQRRCVRTVTTGALLVLVLTAGCGQPESAAPQAPSIVPVDAELGQPADSPGGAMEQAAEETEEN